MITKKEILKLESLLYLYALSKSDSKREVARQMGTSVDTINKYVTDLEAEMNTRFLVSNGRGTTITPEGKRINTLTENIISTIRKVEEYSEAASGYRGSVRLFMSDFIAEYLGPDSIFEFLLKYPDLSLDTTISSELPDMRTFETDIFISCQKPIDRDVVILASKDVYHSLYASEKYIDTFGMPKDLNDLAENHRLCDKTDYHLYAKGWHELALKAKHIIHLTNSVYSHQRYIMAGAGIGVCPDIFGKQHLIRISDGYNFNVRFYLMAHKDIKDMPRIRLVLDYLQHLMKTKPEL